MKKGFKPEKLLVGLPTYGIEFKDGSNKEIQHVQYHDIVQHLETDTRALQKGRYKNTYFETEKLIKRKTRYITRKDLASVFIFDIASDCNNCEHSLIDSLSSEVIPSSVTN